MVSTYECVCCGVQFSPNRVKKKKKKKVWEAINRILQARILDGVAISFSRRSSWPRDETLISCLHISCISRRILYHCTTCEALWLHGIKKIKKGPFLRVPMSHWCWVELSVSSCLKDELVAWRPQVWSNAPPDTCMHPIRRFPSPWLPFIQPWVLVRNA